MAPEVAYVQCPDCGSAAVHTDEGLVPVEAPVVAEIEGRSVPPGSNDSGSEPSTPWAAERPPEERDEPASGPLRELVLRRDGGRCRVPGCASRLEVQVHHIRWLRHGGRTHAGNLISVCAVHHAIIHEGGLIVHGMAPHGVQFLTRVWQPRAIESSA